MSSLPYVLGVDVAKKSLSVCLMNKDSQSIIREASLANEEQDIRQFLKAIPSDIGRSLCVAIEPTNTYWHLFAQMALSRKHKVVSAPPGPAKLFLRSINPRVKNDRLDAKGIALYASCMELRDYQPKSKVVCELEELLCLRRKLSESAAYYRQVAGTGAAGADIARQLLLTHKEQMKDLDSRIAEIMKAFEPAKRLIKVPGFGPVVTAALVARLTASEFRSSDSFVAFVGLDLKVRESGQFRGRRTISHNGDAEMRRLLYLAAQSAIKVKGSPFAQIYERHRSPERGLASTEAICVVARKMARTAWSMVRYGTEYDPARVLLDMRA
jgi:transposase